MTEEADAGTPKVTVTCQFCLTLNRVELSRTEQRPKCGECGKPILLDIGSTLRSTVVWINLAIFLKTLH